MHKHKSSNSCDKADRNTNYTLFGESNYLNLRTDVADKENASNGFNFTLRNKAEMTPNVNQTKNRIGTKITKLDLLANQASFKKKQLVRDYKVNDYGTNDKENFDENSESFSKDLPSQDTEGGEENIKERLSDLYSTHKNVSVRAPKTISHLSEKGVTQSRHFDNNSYMSITDNFNYANKSTLSTNDFGSFITTTNRQRSRLNQSEIGSRSYFTEYSKNKENFEPQTTYQSLNQSDYSLSFGPKATNRVNFQFFVCKFIGSYLRFNFIETRSKIS
jgi:hypothetical protein